MEEKTVLALYETDYYPETNISNKDNNYTGLICETCKTKLIWKDDKAYCSVCNAVAVYA